jgi:TolA-binding protein
MPRWLRAAVAVICAIVCAAPLAAQGSPGADEKELAAYKLTAPTLNKVAAAMRSMAKEMMQDPKYQQIMKVDAQIADLEGQVSKLEAKNDLTEADQKKLDALNGQLEKLNDQKEKMEQSLDTGNPMADNPKSLSEMEQGIAKVPGLARALEREGLSPREYAKFMLAMLQAGMVQGFSRGKVDYSKLPPGVNADNVKFIEEHKAELEALQAEFESLGKINK